MSDDLTTIKYKSAKTLDEQIDYLSTNKRVKFNIESEDNAKEKLLRYNYINVITPFKHNFAKKNRNNEVIKRNNKHIYENDVEFREYYDCFYNERKNYPIIAENIFNFELHFKSVMAYHILNGSVINDAAKLEIYLDELKTNIGLLTNRYNTNRINTMLKQIDDLKDSIVKYPDIYCFFDRVSLGKLLTIYIGLDVKVQKIIFKDLKSRDMVLSTGDTIQFINRTFCLISIRNCIMHCNSLEILVRFYNTKYNYLRTPSNRDKYQRLIQYLSIKKPYIL